MNLNRLYEILDQTTFQFRKGPIINKSEAGPLSVVEIFDMPHESEAPAELTKVDVEFMVVGVDKDLAATFKEELVRIMTTYPKLERLAGGPSYIEVGGELGSQDGALRLFALGEVLGLWKVLTPAGMGLEGGEARYAAGRGLLFMSPWKPEK